jgi:hypothetical protein
MLPASRAHGEGIVLHTLFDLEFIQAVFTLIFVDWHDSFPPTNRMLKKSLFSPARAEVARQPLCPGSGLFPCIVQAHDKPQSARLSCSLAGALLNGRMSILQVVLTL